MGTHRTNIDEKIRRLIRPSVLAMSAYHVPDASGLVKLDAMENPYGWPDEIKQEWLQCLSGIDINRYPDANASELKKKLRSVFSIPAEQDLLLGNGSDEILQIIALAVARQDAVFIAPEPGFVMYRAIAEIAQAKYIGVCLNKDDFSLNLDAMLEAIEQYQPVLVFLAWPNNPTGNLFDEDAIKQIIVSAPGLVILDEAYHAFAQCSFMSYLGQYDNLVVMRTLSKLGLAGLRVGFLAGANSWLQEFEKLRLPYNIGVLTQKSTEFILDHIDILNRQAQEICQGRQALFEQLNLIAGLRVWPSAANFLLFRSELLSGEEIFEKLKQQGILIKNLQNSHPYLENCLRVTVGSRQENEIFIECLQGIL